MIAEKVISVTIALPKAYRDLLRQLVREANMKNPEHTITVSQFGREIVCAALKDILEEREGVTSNDDTTDQQWD